LASTARPRIVPECGSSPLSVKVEAAVVAIIGLVLKLDFHLGAGAARGAVALGLEEQGFGGIEGEIDRIERVDRGEQRGIGALARTTRLPTSTRRSEMRPEMGARTWVIPYPARGRVRGPGRRPARPRRPEGGRAAIDLACRNRLVARKAARARQIERASASVLRAEATLAEASASAAR
jgi:hypothetical protein